MSAANPTPPRPTPIASTTLQRNFGDILRRVVRDKERFIVERGGFPLVVILSATDYEVLTAAEKRGKTSRG